MITCLIGQFAKWQVSLRGEDVFIITNNDAWIYLARKEVGGEPRHAHGPTFV